MHLQVSVSPDIRKKLKDHKNRKVADKMGKIKC